MKPDDHMNSRRSSYRKTKLIALLEMAAEAEKLERYAQAEHLYQLALVHSTACCGSYSVERAAVLWDLARVAEIQQHTQDARSYYERAIVISNAGSLKAHNNAA